MDIQLQFRLPLEPIQEEPEQEDEIEEGKTGGEEEDFQSEVGVDTKEVVAEDESEEDEDHAAQLRVMRARRLPRSLRQESFLQIQSTNNHEEEMENFSESYRSTRGVDLSDGATPPLQARLGNEKRFCRGVLQTEVSKIRWPKYASPKPSVQRKKTDRKKNKTVEEPFPEWLVDLMVNIEEATTHQLVILSPQ
ncbi:uncharacterized protein LOC144465107 isoform X1 [Epinephelus lanceolatus]